MTMGTLSVSCCVAWTMPFATSSQRVMPPKMLKRIARTPGSAVMIRSAATTFWGFELVVVHHDLGVERHDLPLGRRRERIDLGERRAHGVKHRVEPLHDVGGGTSLGDVAIQLEPEAERLMR